MLLRTLYFILLVNLSNPIIFAQDFLETNDLGHFDVQVRAGEPLKKVKSAKGNYFVVQPYQNGDVVYSVRNISKQVIKAMEAVTANGSAQLVSVVGLDGVNSADIAPISRNGIDPVTGRSKVEILDDIAPNKLSLYRVDFGRCSESMCVVGTDLFGANRLRIEVSLVQLRYNDGSRLNLWTLMSSRVQGANDVAAMNRQVDNLINKINSSEKISWINMIDFLTKEADPQFILNQKKWSYTTGVFLKKFPKSFPLFDSAIYDSILDGYRKAGIQRPTTPCPSWVWQYYEPTAKAKFTYARRNEFENFANTIVGQSALAELPQRVVTPQAVNTFVKSAPELDPSFVAGSNVGVSFLVQNTYEHLWRATGSKSGIWGWDSIDNLPAAPPRDFIFSGNYTDLNLKMEDPVSTMNGFKMESWPGDGQYVARNSTSYINDMELVFSIKNLENTPIYLKEVITTGKNLSLNSYAPLEGPIPARGTVSVPLAFNPLTWIYKDNGLKIVFLTKYFSTATFVFETDTVPKKKFFRTIRIQIDYSKAPLIIAALNKNEQALWQLRNYFIEQCFGGEFCQKSLAAIHIDSVERVEDVLALDSISNPLKALFPLIGSPGKKIDYRFFGQRGGMLLSSSVQSPLIIPSELGKIVVQPPATSSPSIGRASENDPVVFYTGLNVGGISVVQETSSVNRNLMTAINEPIALIKDQQMINFGKVGKDEEKFKFLTLKSQTFLPLKLLESNISSSAAFLVVTASSEVLSPFLSTYSLLRFKPLFSGSYYSAYKLKFSNDLSEGYTFWLAGEADLGTTTTSYPYPSSSPQASPSVLLPTVPLVYINSGLVQTNQNFETDIGTVKARKDPVWMDVLIQNPSSVPFDITKVNVDAGFKMDPAVFTAKTVAPRSVIAFKLSIDPTSAGAKSGYLRLTYRVGSVLKDLNFRIGGISWSASLATTENPVLGARPSPSPSASTNPNFKEFGSEHLALSRAKTSAAYISLIPKLTLEEGENILNSAFGTRTDLKSLMDFIRASKRAVLSEGAKSVMESAKADLEKQNATAYLRKISDLIRTMNNDFLCKGRSDLIRAVSTVPAFKNAVRVYTQLAIKSLAAERLPNTNSLGRYYMRLAFLRAYLSTNPPLEEAWETIQPSLLQLKDDISRAPLLNAFLAQFPEAAYAVAEAAKGN